MSDATPRFGQALAAVQPLTVPWFDHLDWTTASDPDGDSRDILALQCGGKLSIDPQVAVNPSLNLNLTPSGSSSAATFQALIIDFV